jgi:hypothetical protein
VGDFRFFGRETAVLLITKSNFMVQVETVVFRALIIGEEYAHQKKQKAFVT